MLNALFGSETRVKVLNLLLFNPEKKYNLRELVKEIGVQSNSTRKELNNLVNFGLLKEDDGNWTMNKDFIIYPELKDLLVKSQILSSQKFIDGLKNVSNPKFLALTGTFTGDKDAQTDILIVGKIKRRAFLKLITELEKDLGKEVNFTIMDEAEFIYRQDVMDIFLYNILTSKIIILVNSFQDDNKKQENDKSNF